MAKVTTLTPLILLAPKAPIQARQGQKIGEVRHPACPKNLATHIRDSSAEKRLQSPCSIVRWRVASGEWLDAQHAWSLFKITLSLACGIQSSQGQKRRLAGHCAASLRCSPAGTGPILSTGFRITCILPPGEQSPAPCTALRLGILPTDAGSASRGFIGPGRAYRRTSVHTHPGSREGALHGTNGG